MCSLPSLSVEQHSTTMVNIECDLDDPAFIAVAPTDRFLAPFCRTAFISSTDFTSTSVKPLTYTPSGDSLRSRPCLLPESRSMTSSL